MSNSDPSRIGWPIEDSLIGKEVDLSRSTALPRALRLMLGDHSRVAIP